VLPFDRDEPASADFERLEEIVVRDHELTRRLWIETDAAAFVETVARLAAERGLRISAEDVRRAAAFRREQWWKRFDG
jgi:EAL domain-containing protein (putative c-di-GMP-specific phosphodiesterase class I)